MKDLPERMLRHTSPMKGLRTVIYALSLALVLSSCSSTKPKKVSENPQPKVTKPIPSCSNEEFTDGSNWIKGQLKAFGDDDPAKAYSYASEGFRKRTNIDMFTVIIVGQYSMLLNIKNYQILSCEKTEGRFLFKGKLEDKDGNKYTMQYMLSLIDNKWGVDGAQVSEKLDRISY